MMPLDTIQTGMLVKPFVVWVALAVAWVAACVWIEQDARRVFRKSRRWKALFMGVGTIFVLGTILGGRSVIPITAILLPAAMTWYLIRRETTVLRHERLVTLERLLDSWLIPLARLLRLEHLLDKIPRNRRSAREAAPNVPLVLLKKDGTPYSAAHRGHDRDIADAVQTLERTLSKAIMMRATDIHIEPKSAQGYQVRFRVDGMLQPRQEMSAEDGRAVVSAIKVLADMDIAERRKPQDGSFAATASGRRFDIRVSSSPTDSREKLSLRLLESDGGLVESGLNDLGMRNSDASKLRELISRSQGMLIVTGPTGSGKTTTLYGCLHEIDAMSRNVVTIEEPIEYRLENITQIAVNTQAGLTFAKILRSVLRQDPDVILVGEIRDQETAEIALQAAMTGHLVLTTLHANDSCTTFIRLMDYANLNLIQSAVSAVLAQRLVRLLCPSCKVAYEPPKEWLKKERIPPERVSKIFKEGSGCVNCDGTGFKGRTGVYELLVPDSKFRSLLVGRPSLEDLRAACGGMRTLWQSALYKVISGHTSLAEAERVVR